MITEKACGTCKEVIPIDRFGINRQAKDGHAWSCLLCRKLRNRRYEAENHDKMLVYRRGWEAANRTERSRRMLARWHANEATRAAAKARRQADPSKTRAYTKAWRARNPEAVRTMTRRRRAALAMVATEAYDAVQIFERDGWTCALCGGAVDRSLSYPHLFSATVDHIVPISRGGPDTVANVQTAHLTCNSSKGATVPVEV